MRAVYHFTDTARLPWILQSGELRPGLTRPKGWPADFLWATKRPELDGTSSASALIQSFPVPMGIRAVRIALPAGAFLPWSTVLDRFPEWERRHVDGLEWHARGKSRPADWMIRAEPLPISEWLLVETRGAADNRWFRLDVAGALVETGGNTCGVNIDGYVYTSERMTKADGSPETSPQGTPMHRPLSVRPMWDMLLRQRPAV
jgi:hypothetical protein